MDRILSKTEIDSVIKKIIHQLQAAIGERLTAVVLFGSYSRGTADGESDVDVLVVVDGVYDDVRKKYFEKIIDIGFEASLETGITVSLLLDSTDKIYKYQNIMPFYKNVIKEGKNYYGRLSA